jgi:2-methylcitrate dehydratase
MTSKYTVEKIAEFVDGCSNSAIQPDVRDLVARHLLDSIGCAIGAMGAKVTQDIKAVVDAFGGNQMCTLIGGGLTSPDRAALYNGCLVRYLDFMDAYSNTTSPHPCSGSSATSV